MLQDHDLPQNPLKGPANTTPAPGAGGDRPVLPGSPREHQAVASCGDTVRIAFAIMFDHPPGDGRLQERPRRKGRGEMRGMRAMPGRDLVQ